MHVAWSSNKCSISKYAFSNGFRHQATLRIARRIPLYPPALSLSERFVYQTESDTYQRPRPIDQNSKSHQWHSPTERPFVANRLTTTKPTVRRNDWLEVRIHYPTSFIHTSFHLPIRMDYDTVKSPRAMPRSCSKVSEHGCMLHSRHSGQAHTTRLALAWRRQTNSYLKALTKSFR